MLRSEQGLTDGRWWEHVAAPQTCYHPGRTPAHAGQKERAALRLPTLTQLLPADAMLSCTVALLAQVDWVPLRGV